jgi:hypothetical protein
MCVEQEMYFVDGRVLKIIECKRTRAIVVISRIYVFVHLGLHVFVVLRWKIWLSF